jgi:hypothetical protein
MAIVFESRMATRVIGTAGREVAALPDFVSVDDDDEVARAAMMAVQ